MNRNGNSITTDDDSNSSDIFEVPKDPEEEGHSMKIIEDKE